MEVSRIRAKIENQNSQAEGYKQKMFNLENEIIQKYDEAIMLNMEAAWFELEMAKIETKLKQKDDEILNKQTSIQKTEMEAKHKESILQSSYDALCQ